MHINFELSNESFIFRCMQAITQFLLKSFLHVFFIKYIETNHFYYYLSANSTL